MSELSQPIGDISPEAQELFQMLLQQQGIDTQLSPTITKRTITSPCQLSFAQQRLWFLQQLNPQNAVYNMPAAIRIQGKLNIPALSQTFQAIGQRHEILRTAFVTIDGQPVQVITPTSSLSLSVVDLQMLPNLEREHEVLRLATAESQLAFNLSQSPLLRITLLHLDATEYVLLLTMHHIIADGWSIEVLIKEVRSLYIAFCSDQPISCKDATRIPLAELPIQYADFAVWQRQWLEGKRMTELMAYWQQKLGNQPPILQLPTDRPRPVVQSFRGANLTFSLSPDLTAALKALSQQEGTTLFMTLLAAFKTLLYHYTGQEDILIGSPIANRNWAQTAGLIGFFVNTLVLRSQLSDHLSFRELLAEVRKTALAAYEHQDLPFEKLVAELQSQRDLSRNPLITVMFALQNISLPVLEFAGLTLNPISVNSGVAKFDLTMILSETSPGLSGVVEYNSDLFDATTIARMVKHWQTLLAGIVAHPSESLLALPLLTKTEQHQLLHQWNCTNINYPQQYCLHQRFEIQVEKTPNAVAVVVAEQQLTYQSLNQQANQLAHYLQSLGIKPEEKVGICLERTLEMVVGILGILKAGAAYVPLDPMYPPERLAWIVQDAQIEVLLTQQHLIANLPQHPARVICLDRDWEIIAQENLQNPFTHVQVNHLAYVIYTSGSTGQPKGVLITHDNVTHLFDAVQADFNFDHNDVWTLFHSIAFDFSVWELWGALLHGGRLVIVPYWLSLSPTDFYHLLCQQQVTVLNQTPSAFRQLIHVEESLENVQNLALRLVIFGGEALDISSLQPWFQRHGDQSPQLVNMYGITETTVHVTYHHIKITDSGSIIGRPISDLQVYLLDKNYQPVPIGVSGEMYIGGAGVARGYLHRPDLTAQKFIPHPFSHLPHARLYQSGDLARYLPNGDIEYLGRIDQQVKIRGFRIELGELASKLNQYPDVQESVVITKEIHSSDKQLIAYFVPHQNKHPQIEELRNFLKQLLPEYMLPSAFIRLEALPLTANSKLDYQKLPNPPNIRPELDIAFVAPNTSAEKKLAQIWSQVLGVAEIGIHDNFFALGGDSIRSIQVRSLAQTQGLNFSIQQLFQYPTIHELLLYATTTSNSITAEIPPFSLISEADRRQLPQGIEDAYPLTMLQLGMIYHHEYNFDVPIYHNVNSIHLQAPLNLPYLQMAIQQLVNRHPVLRTSFDLSNYSEPLQLVHQQVIISLPLEDLCHLNADEQEQVLTTKLETEKLHKFNWQYPPLVRFYIYRRSENTFQFGFTEHHTILDGWSVATMLTELFENYFSLLNGEAITIQAAPAIAFRNFVSLQQKALKSPKNQQYWQQKLQGIQNTQLNRWQLSDNPTKTAKIREVKIPINSEIAAGIHKVAQIAQVPLKSVLVAAHLAVISQLSGQSDVVTIVSSNGRPETTDNDWSLGLFLTPLPLRMQFAGGNWLDLAQQTFATEQELLPYRWYPLAQIQINLGGQRLADTSVNFTHFHVYQRLQKISNLQMIDSTGFGMTDFTLVAEFSLDVFLSQIRLSLMCNTSELSDRQIDKIVQNYSHVLKSIAQEPTKNYAYFTEEQQKQLASFKADQSAELDNINLQKLKTIKRKNFPIP